MILADKKLGGPTNCGLLFGALWANQLFLSFIPRDVYNRFGTICFASYSKFLVPVLILSPYSVAPGVLRDNWFNMFHNVSFLFDV